MTDLMELERRGWRALSTDRDAAVAFYAGMLAEEAVMVFPGGMWLDGRGAILEAIDARPWEHVDLAFHREVPLGTEARLLVYRADARRAGAQTCSALVASSYVHRDGAWHMTHHQQTPV